MRMYNVYLSMVVTNTLEPLAKISVAAVLGSNVAERAVMEFTNGTHLYMPSVKMILSALRAHYQDTMVIVTYGKEPIQ